MVCHQLSFNLMGGIPLLFFSTLKILTSVGCLCIPTVACCYVQVRPEVIPDGEETFGLETNSDAEPGLQRCAEHLSLSLRIVTGL